MNPSYAYWASLSGYYPREFLTESQHQDIVFRRNGFDNSTLGERGRSFFRAKSGLTPPDSYTVTQHINAYFAPQPDSWEAQLESAAIGVYEQLWLEQRRNLFDDSLAGDGTATYWVAGGTTPTLSKVSGASFGRTNAVRFTNGASGAQRSGARIALTPSTTYTVRFRALGSVARGTWQINYRPAGSSSTSGQVSLASNATLDDTPRDFEFVFTTTATSASAPLLGFVNGSGNTGEYIEITDFEVELGNTAGMGWIGGPRTDTDSRVRWTGTVNASDIVLEVPGGLP